ncbi:hypothetical protein, partial [Burkholderia contaminans]|uniref:hypothetical protein n=1 Tax=Burkholderia contaminans TaxID=488447 RepID=UPI003CC94687
MPVLSILLADLVADRIFLLVQHVLFALRDVAVILRSHVPLFPADLAVVTMQARGRGACGMGPGRRTCGSMRAGCRR